jgi:hypothetical protein
MNGTGSVSRDAALRLDQAYSRDGRQQIDAVGRAAKLNHLARRREVGRRQRQIAEADRTEHGQDTLCIGFGSGQEKSMSPVKRGLP